MSRIKIDYATFCRQYKLGENTHLAYKKYLAYLAS